MIYIVSENLNIINNSNKFFLKIEIIDLSELKYILSI